MDRQTVWSGVRIACWFFACVLLWPAPPAEAVARLEIPGIPGEAAAPLPGQIDVLSFSFDNVAVIGQRPAKKPEVCGGKRQPSVQSITVTKLLDKASPKLYEAAALGTPLPTVILHLFKDVLGPTEYATVELTDTLISSIKSGGAADDFPTETVSFTFGKIKWTYTKTDSAGGNPETTTAAWNVCEPGATRSPTPIAGTPRER